MWGFMLSFFLVVFEARKKMKKISLLGRNSENKISCISRCVIRCEKGINNYIRVQSETWGQIE
jgi:hypothetical protein